METRVVSTHGREVFIGENHPVTVIGERIHPFGKGPLKEAMRTGEMDPIRTEAQKQVEAGAHILMISTAAFGLDETQILPRVTQAVMEVVDVPLCLESRNPAALEKTLRLGCGRPIISSVNGEKAVMDPLLSLVKVHETALILLTSDDLGVPSQAEKRVEIVARILDRSDRMGIPRDSLLIDCVAESCAVNPLAAKTTLTAMQRVKAQWGFNLVLGASNVSFGLPFREVINAVFLSLAIHHGLNAAIVNTRSMKLYLMAAEVLSGKDPQARRYTAYCRTLLKNRSAKTPEPS